MAEYLGVQLEYDAGAVKQEMTDRLIELIPDLVIQPGTVVDFLLEVVAELGAEDRQLLSEVTIDGLFDYFGEKILRVPKVLATPATGSSTWTRVDTPSFPLSAPLTIPAGTQITLRGDADTRVGFETVEAVTFPAADASTDAGEVDLVALEPGAAGTGLQADPLPEGPLAWIGTITVVAPTANGEDAEDDLAYRNRLADTAQLLAKTLVLPEDFEIDARNNVPGVFRATAIDLYDADTDTPDVEGHITVAVQGDDGLDPGAGVRADVLARQQALSVTDLTVHVIHAIYTGINVVFAAKCFPQFDPADVEARAEAAVLDFLDPAQWGLPPFGDQLAWVNTPVVRYRDVVAVIENVEGLDYTTSVTVNAGTADVTMPNIVPLPASNSTAAGTVTAP